MDERKIWNARHDSYVRIRYRSEIFIYNTIYRKSTLIIIKFIYINSINGCAYLRSYGFYATCNYNSPESSLIKLGARSFLMRDPVTPAAGSYGLRAPCSVLREHRSPDRTPIWLMMGQLFLFSYVILLLPTMITYH